MILDISKTKFEESVPSAIDPECGLYARVLPFLEEADQMLLASLLGDDLYNALHDAISLLPDGGTSDMSPLSPATDFRQPATIAMIADSVMRHVVNRAMELAIPQLDLILTSSGFGVVSSSQIAPASRDRVENLRRSCARAALYYRDRLLLQLLGNSHTQPLAIASPVFVTATSSLFWTEEQVGDAVPNTEAPKTLRELRPKIGQAEAEIAKRISREQLVTLFDKMRQSDLTSAQLQVVGMLRLVAGALVSLSPGSPKAFALRYLRNIYEVMEDNPDDFAEYHSSSVYAGRHAPTYENRAQDPLFALL